MLSNLPFIAASLPSRTSMLRYKGRVDRAHSESNTGHLRRKAREVDMAMHAAWTAPVPNFWVGPPTVNQMGTSPTRDECKMPILNGGQGRKSSHRYADFQSRLRIA